MTEPTSNNALLTKAKSDWRLWIFGLEKAIDQEDLTKVDEKLNGFLSSWKAHGKPLEAECAVYEGRFILVAASPSTLASGCSIDALFKVVSSIASEFKNSVSSPGDIFFRNPEELSVAHLNRQEFKNSYNQAILSADTVVFDLTVDSFEKLQSGGFEKSLKDSWHQKLVQ